MLFLRAFSIQSLCQSPCAWSRLILHFQHFQAWRIESFSFCFVLVTLVAWINWLKCQKTNLMPVWQWACVVVCGEKTLNTIFVTGVSNWYRRRNWKCLFKTMSTRKSFSFHITLSHLAKPCWINSISLKKWLGITKWYHFYFVTSYVKSFARNIRGFSISFKYFW